MSGRALDAPTVPLVALVHTHEGLFFCGTNDNALHRFLLPYGNGHVTRLIRGRGSACVFIGMRL
jgi:hypothetical protein